MAAWLLWQRCSTARPPRPSISVASALAGASPGGGLGAGAGTVAADPAEVPGSPPIDWSGP
eukprot:1182246-Alexandrium_andersonii.AAC.1